MRAEDLLESSVESLSQEPDFMWENQQFPFIKSSLASFFDHYFCHYRVKNSNRVKLTTAQICHW